MKKAQIKGSSEDIQGKFQEQAGKSTGGKEREAKGTQVGRRPEILKKKLEMLKKLSGESCQRGDRRSIVNL